MILADLHISTFRKCEFDRVSRDYGELDGPELDQYWAKVETEICDSKMYPKSLYTNKFDNNVPFFYFKSINVPQNASFTSLISQSTRA